MARRILFVIRGKLGDSVVSFATVRAWADAYSADEVTLLVRANYAPLYAREAGIRVIGFSSRLAMFAKLAWMRFAEPPFDALMVLLGYGAPIERLGRMVRAARKVYMNDRLAHVFPEWPQIPKDHVQPEPAWRVATVVAPELPMPRQSRLASLAALRRPEALVGIAPLSDEARRSMKPVVVRELVGVLVARHPGCSVHVLVNRSDRDAQPLLEAGLPPGGEFREFPELEALVAELARLDHLYTTDTGIYHLAVAMGVPTTVFYGPTQPWKNGMPDQPGLARVRLAALGGEHCDEKRCMVATCLNHAVTLHMEAATPVDVDATPASCLLRRHATHELATLSLDESPRHQA